MKRQKFSLYLTYLLITLLIFYSKFELPSIFSIALRGRFTFAPFFSGRCVYPVISQFETAQAPISRPITAVTHSQCVIVCAVYLQVSQELFMNTGA